MRLQHITATPHPAGNRIDLRWEYPETAVFTGVRLVRRAGTHPTAPDDGAAVPVAQVELHIQRQPDGATEVLRFVGADVPIEDAGDEWRITHGGRLYVVQKQAHRLRIFGFAEDRELKAETVYYYMLFPETGDSSQPYVFDRHNRVAALVTGRYSMAGQMYDLLPAIYHRYDTRLPATIPDDMAPEDTERGQLRRFLDLPGGQLDEIYSFAKALLNVYDLDQADGAMLPLLAQWIGWATDYRLDIADQRRELRYAPYLYPTIGLIPTLEATVKRLLGWESRTKEFVHNVFCSNTPERLNLWLRQRSSTGAWSQPTKPLSLNFAYEGRPAAVQDSDVTLWLFFHTLRQGRWEIWYKTYRAGQDWAPSQPLVKNQPIVKYPTAALQGTTLWLFWLSYDEQGRRWQLYCRTREEKKDWSHAQLFEAAAGDTRTPCAVADNDGGLWLFWIEQAAGRWQVRYQRHNGAKWEPESAATLPLGDGKDPKVKDDLVEDDLFVLFHPYNAELPLWVFWARREPIGKPGQTRWRVAYRVKQKVTDDWSETRTLPPLTWEDDDREPAALACKDGTVEVFWSSTRAGSWSVWHTLLDSAAGEPGTAERITGNPYSQRSPLPIAAPAETLLVYRSNESLSYASDNYTATRTLDMRYAGCTTVDTRNLTKTRALRGRFEDFQTYVFDTGPGGARTKDNRYARDTVGSYLTPNIEDPARVERNVKRLENVLRTFIPTQVRHVSIIEERFFYRDLVYTNDDSTAQPERLIGERTFDSVIRSVSPDVYRGLRDAHADTAPGWIWLRAWSTNSSDQHTVDFRATPISTKWRTWHTGLESGG